jgi:SAM-dependent methyltransferase
MAAPRAGMNETAELKLEPTVISEILDEAANHTDPNMYRAALDDRLFVEQQVADQARHRSGKIIWPAFEGRYSEVRLSDDYSEENRNPHMNDPLAGLELVWAEHIDRQLEAGSDEPVIMLDFGGGLSQSMIRIAGQEKYRQAIADGKLLLISSSLGEVPPSEPDEAGFTGVARLMNAMNHGFGEAMDYSAEDLDFAQEYQKWVTYIDATAAELENMSVTTADGRQVPLLGHVDSIHEQCAVEHSHIPDVAFATFAKMLKPGGLLYLRTLGPNYLSGTGEQEYTSADGRTVRTDAAYQQQRELAVTVGLAVLPRLGVERITDSPAGPQILQKANNG